jgi:hypothetical protein
MAGGTVASELEKMEPFEEFQKERGMSVGIMMASQPIV